MSQNFFGKKSLNNNHKTFFRQWKKKRFTACSVKSYLIESRRGLERGHWVDQFQRIPLGLIILLFREVKGAKRGLRGRFVFNRILEAWVLYRWVIGICCALVATMFSNFRGGGNSIWENLTRKHSFVLAYFIYTREIIYAWITNWYFTS